MSRLRTSAIQVNLMALGLASVGADEEVKGTAHGIKMKKVAEILSILQNMNSKKS